MTQRKFGKQPKYGLADMAVGETKAFPDMDTLEKRHLLRRSAHNYNLRSDMYFQTRSKDGVSYVTRVR
jgi:hypothetical protein